MENTSLSAMQREDKARSGKTATYFEETTGCERKSLHNDSLEWFQ